MAARRRKGTRGRPGRGAPEAPVARVARRRYRLPLTVAASAVLLAAVYLFLDNPPPKDPAAEGPSGPGPARTDLAGASAAERWIGRARLVSNKFHEVYTPCWEGAYGAFGDARLFEVTGDSALLRFHLIEHDLTRMCGGTWVDDRAWVCLAELEWWRVTGRAHMGWIGDAVRRYDEARAEGRLSTHDGYWSWYNWPPSARVNEPVFTNSNMNQMAAAACGLFLATGRKRFLDDALLVWNGDGQTPGIEARLYRGEGRWEGRAGRAAFGKELPWGGLGYASIAAALHRATGEARYREIAVATVKRLLDPATGWVDPVNYYQLKMDGNGNFVQFILDVWEIAPDDLPRVPAMVEKMLEHVWTNDGGNARLLLHRASDHGIRNGWNPRGGEDGYGVDEVGTVHAQGEAAKAFGYYANVAARIEQGGAAPR